MVLSDVSITLTRSFTQKILRKNKIQSQLLSAAWITAEFHFRCMKWSIISRMLYKERRYYSTIGSTNGCATCRDVPSCEVMDKR